MRIPYFLVDNSWLLKDVIRESVVEYQRTLIDNLIDNTLSDSKAFGDLGAPAALRLFKIPQQSLSPPL